MKKITIITLIVSLLITSFAGCTNNSSKNTVKNFLTALYSVNQSDYDYYEKMVKGSKSSELEADTKVYKTNTRNFQQYLSDKSYQSFYNERLSYLRIANAYNNNYFTKIKDLKISKTKEDKINETITYHYEFQLNQTNKDTKKLETINKSGVLTVFNENGTWKILDIIVL